MTDFYGSGEGTSHSGGLGINGLTNVETRSVLHLSFSDSLFAYGPIADMTFSLTRNGVSTVRTMNYVSKR